MVPKNQNARQTRGLAPSKAVQNRALYMAHEVDGAPGSGSMELRRRELNRSTQHCHAAKKVFTLRFLSCQPL